MNPTLKKVFEWLVVNVYFLLIVLAGAGAFWLFHAGIKALDYGGNTERALMILAGIASVFCAYCFERCLHRLISAHIR